MPNLSTEAKILQALIEGDDEQAEVLMTNQLTWREAGSLATVASKLHDLCIGRTRKPDLKL